MKQIEEGSEEFMKLVTQLAIDHLKIVVCNNCGAPIVDGFVCGNCEETQKGTSELNIIL